MPLSDLASIGSVFSSLAIAVSLIYLGIQTHQAAKHTRALISQGHEGLLSNDQLSDLGAAVGAVLRRPGSHQFWERWKAAHAFGVQGVG